MRRVIIIGGKGNGTVVCSSIEDSIKRSGAVDQAFNTVLGDWEIAGWLNDAKEVGEMLNGYPTLGKVDEAKKFNDPDTYFIYCLMSPLKAIERYKRLQSLGIPSEKFAIFQHPMSSVGRNCRLGYGTVLEPGAILAPDVTLGNHVHMRASSVGHDSVIGDACLITVQTGIGSYVTAGRGVHFGINCSIKEHVTIGDFAVIGMGTVVIHDVKPYSIMAGNPARKIGEVEHETS